ncbi:hypothetical protein [Aneurinibacillus sp. REN35]
MNIEMVVKEIVDSIKNSLDHQADDVILKKSVQLAVKRITANRKD